jgi:aldehyde:ferredoxin oxidoreductase
LGTASVAEYFDSLRLMPKRYFQTGVYPEELLITGASIKASILAGVSACHACVIACGRVVKLEDGARRKGPEYETLVGFGPNLWLNDNVFATRMGELCDRYGMDSISLSNTIGLAISLYEKGVIREEDTSGLKLNWGDKQAVEELVHQTVRKEGLGAWIAEGARALGRHFSMEDEAVQVNGLEVAYHDPRGASGMALVYATSPRGACHNQSDYFMVEVGQVETSLGFEQFPLHGGGEKAANVALHQDWRTLFNSLVLCLFANVPPSSVVSLINAACGLDWDIHQMMQAGERGWNLKRVINNRLGLRAEHDRLPKRLLMTFPPDNDSGEFAPDLEGMLAAYYTARSWDPASGYPMKEKLNQLGLGWVVDDLWSKADMAGDVPNEIP